LCILVLSEGDKFDEEEDSRVVKFLKRDTVSKFSVIVMLTPRPRYAGRCCRFSAVCLLPTDIRLFVMLLVNCVGGPVVAELSIKPDEQEVAAYDEDAEDRAYDEENEIDEPGSAAAHEKDAKEPKEPKEPKKYNALTTKYGRYQPELGTVFFIRSDHMHTVLPVKRGYRTYLAIELWGYQSSPVPSSGASGSVMARPGIMDAKPFPKKEEF
jgi:hypothetical protein